MIGRLGAGGMRHVYLRRSLADGSLAAAKSPISSGEVTSADRRRFAREVKLARLAQGVHTARGGIGCRGRAALDGDRVHPGPLNGRTVARGGPLEGMQPGGRPGAPAGVELTLIFGCSTMRQSTSNGAVPRAAEASHKRRWRDFRDLVVRARIQLGGPIFLVWDNVRLHATSGMREFIEASAEWLTVFQLPTYAPELNPQEGIWSLVKRDIGNLAAPDLTQLTRAPEAPAQEDPGPPGPR
nr:transposase [Streptomyces sp. WM6372]